jgi:transitional endoplasmic reticulum ATPase
MNESTLTGLEAALTATPGNVALRKVLLQGYLDASLAARGKGCVEGAPEEAWRDEEAALLGARVCLQAKAGELALRILPAEGSEADLLRARAFALLERHPEGLAAYRRAIAANPTLEDPDLESLLGATVRAITSGPQRLRVIANDDTSETETARLLQPEAKKVTFADVGGLEDVKEQVRRRIILPFQKPSLFEKFKRRAGGGILLYGPPGCGKTLLARATAGECKATFLAVAISDVLDMYIGESERKLHALFEKARTSAPAVLFFDELEALAGKREYARESTGSKLVSHFLSEMDGFSQNNKGVLILGATNVPWAVDSAFRRPGRFDRVQFVPPPDREARASILGLHLKGRPMEAGIDAKKLAEKTPGYTGADLEHIVETAADLAIARSIAATTESPITAADLHGALEEVKPTSMEWLTTARNYARYANESGQYDEVLAWLEKNGKA